MHFNTIFYSGTSFFLGIFIIKIYIYYKKSSSINSIIKEYMVIEDATIVPV